MKFTNRALLIESWVLWSLGLAIVAMRMVSRRIKLGNWRSFGIDDYLMVFAFANFTGVVVSINLVAKNGSNYLPEEVAKNLDKQGRENAIFGSIMTFSLELFTLTALWTVKACLLILYARLTNGIATRQNMLVKIAAAYCALTYLITVLLFLFYWCHPTVVEYWRVPVKYEQCATYFNHLIFATACNISSDLMLFFIPIPIIIKTRLPLKRKIILCAILGLGVFNILSSVLNRFYNFHDPNTYVFLYWYVAEVGVAMFVGNMPLCWPVLRLVIGGKDDSQTPAYEHRYPTISLRRRKKPKTGLTTLGDDTMWDKLDDQEETMVDKSQNRNNGSDQGSMIELVNQGRSHAAVSSEPGHKNGLEPSLGNSSYPHRESAVTGNESDKIMVVTTVDVSSR